MFKVQGSKPYSLTFTLVEDLLFPLNKPYMWQNVLVTPNLLRSIGADVQISQFLVIQCLGYRKNICT